MPQLGLETHTVDAEVYRNTLRRFRERDILLPTFAQLADPDTIPAEIVSSLDGVDPLAPHPRNLFRVHWYNDDRGRGRAPVPEHLVLPRELTGVDARIVVLLGDRFPMIQAHKVLAAYGCLVPRIVTGQFDPTAHKAVWPSTGNYCRGGVAISRIMACRGVAVLPEGMSRERFQWLEEWVTEPEDIIRTPGSESNVKEIYDKCAELDRDPHNIIFNQFSEFGNHLAHYLCTGRAGQHVFELLAEAEPGLRLRAFVSASGSGGTLGAGDYLKDAFGSLNVVVEALECPTLLYNGFGEHNIQGIGDKHVPLIHNVMNTDVALAVSERATDSLNALFNTETGRSYLAWRRKVPPQILEHLGSLGLSSICNILAAIKTAKYYGMDERDVLLTVATDGASLYHTERDRTLERDFGGTFGELEAAEVYAEHMLGTATDHLLELSWPDRRRIFNLGYFTWVEQQGLSIEEFQARRSQDYWRGLRDLLPAWDARIEEFNRATP